MSENPNPAAEAYLSRPWLKHYPPFVPADLTPQYASGLDMFLAAAHAVPDKTCLYYFDRTISFAEVDRQSSVLAAALQARGVGYGDRVALYLQNIPQFVIAVYASWKVGAIVVLCNPMFKQRELEYHLNDSGAKVLICLENLYLSVARETVGQTAVEVVITTSELDLLGTQPIPPILQTIRKERLEGTIDMLDLLVEYDGTNPDRYPLKSSDTAYLTYTSGTTGQPKGAIISHTNIVFNATMYHTWLQLTPDDVSLAVAPFFHITGLMAHIATSSLARIPLILFYRFEPGEALRLIEKWRATFTIGAITVFIALMEHPDFKKRDLSSLRVVYSGGAPIPPAVIENFKQLTGVYIGNTYGMTETTGPSHNVPLGVAAPIDPASGALAVGVPEPNTLCRIVDPNTGQDLPVGEVGELITKGPSVVSGYWQKPAETANAIRDGYMYTGDVGKMDADGWFYLVDRKKDMIIASGYKVWPREVEDVLYQHPAVREAIVIGVPDEYRGETVKAFVALKTGAEATPQELIEFSKARMANYKYPRQIEILDDLPKTLTGKFLRRALRQEQSSVEGRKSKVEGQN